MKAGLAFEIRSNEAFSTFKNRRVYAFTGFSCLSLQNPALLVSCNAMKHECMLKKIRAAVWQ
jgi:hypothetical protein